METVHVLKQLEIIHFNFNKHEKTKSGPGPAANIKSDRAIEHFSLLFHSTTYYTTLYTGIAWYWLLQ